MKVYNSTKPKATTYLTKQAPWIDNPYKLVSLWEIMERFYVNLIIMLSETLAQLTLSQRSGSNILDEEDRKKLKLAVSSWADHFSGLGLRTSTWSARRLLELADNPSATFSQLQNLCDELHGRMQDELWSSFLLHVPDDRVDYYEKPLNGLNIVLEKFPSSVFDFEESAKCYALGRSVASVLHAMRVLELGLTALGRRLGVNTDKRNWHNVIVDIESAVKTRERSEKSSPDLTFYAEAAGQFMHFKEAWRNHVMHVRQVFDEERAKRILDHVREFMGHLAAGGLSEESP